MKLKLADDLALPHDVVTEKLAWLGRTGSGKTYGAMKLAELMLGAGAQVGAIDPVGVWRALRVPAPGGQSFEVVVFGGLYGDLPLEPTAGELIADLVCDRALSFVLDVSQFIPAEQQRFVKAFADRFFHRKKSKPSAVHLFLEECQEFIPENPSGLEAQTLGVMQRLWKLGRNFGIGGSLISQRPQEIAKKALNMSGTLFAFQMTGPQERKAIKAWVADHGVALDIESVLQKLRTGEPHVESPTFLEVSKTVQILPRVTADLSSTPKVGGSKVATKPLTPIDVEQLKASMAATIEKAKADDPRELRKQIAELQKQLSTTKQGLSMATGAQQALVKQKTVEKFVLKDGQLARAEGLLTTISNEIARHESFVKGRIDMLRELTKEIAGAIRQTHHTATSHQSAVVGRPSPVSPQARGVAPAPATSRPARLVSRASGPGDSGLPKGERIVLSAVAQYPEGAARDQLSVLTGYKKSSRDTYLQRLNERGYIHVNGNGITATQAGVDALGSDFEPLPTGDALRDWWQQRLPMGESAVLSCILGGGREGLERDVISEATGYKKSSRDTYIQRLVARRLVVVERGLVRASDSLFD